MASSLTQFDFGYKTRKAYILVFPHFFSGISDKFSYTMYVSIVNNYFTCYLQLYEVTERQNIFSYLLNQF